MPVHHVRLYKWRYVQLSGLASLIGLPARHLEPKDARRPDANGAILDAQVLRERLSEVEAARWRCRSRG
jgi:hypothetical protein